MDKIMEFWYNKDTKEIEKYKHLIMFDLGKKELEELSVGDDFVGEYKNKLNDLNESEEFQSWMSYEEDQKMILNTEKDISYNEGLDEGQAKGQKEKQLEIALSMLKNNEDIEKIKQYTGLTEEELKKL